MSLKKILNLYAGIGGNRLFWDSDRFDFQITAVENDPQIAEIYQNNFPNDIVRIDDAHQFLIENYQRYDLIWSSPPCQTHSTIRYNLGVKPLIPPTQKIQSHFFWTNFYFPSMKIKSQLHKHGEIKELEERKKISLQNYKITYRKKRQILRNAVPPEIGLHILNAALDFQINSEQKYFNFST